MVQTTDLGERNDPAASGRFDVPGIRRVLAESKVRPGNVVVAEKAFQDSSQMALVEDHHVIQAFTPNRLDDAFDIRILSRGTWCNENLLDSEGMNAAHEVLAVDTVAVTDQIPGDRVPRKRSDELSAGRFSSGMFGDV